MNQREVISDALFAILGGMSTDELYIELGRQRVMCQSRISLLDGCDDMTADRKQLGELRDAITAMRTVLHSPSTSTQK